MERLRAIKAKKRSKTVKDNEAFDKMQLDNYEDEVNFAEEKTVTKTTPGKPVFDTNNAFKVTLTCLNSSGQMHI